VDRTTRHDLKSDKFVQEVAHSVEFLESHRGQLIRYGSIVLALVVVGVGLYYFLQTRKRARFGELSSAMLVYNSAVGPDLGNRMRSFPTEEARQQAIKKSMNGFIEKYEEGYDIVYGVRESRKSDTAFKRGSAQLYYRFLHFMGVDIVYNHADYRLMSRRAVEALSQYEEVNLFLRGIVPLIGFKSAIVYYARSERFAGVSKYPLKKMLSFAFDGITSFSIRPIRMITFLGLFISVMSVFLILYIVISSFFNRTVSGWNSIVCSLWLLGGLQLLAIGIVGEYIGKIYLEVKHRPRFFEDEYLK